MSLCYAFPSFSLCEALLVKQRTLYFLGMKMLQSEICLLLNIMSINESYHISSGRSLRKFTGKLPFFKTCLILNYQKWKEN